MRTLQSTAPTLAGSVLVRGRLVGAAAIAFAVLVVIENLVVHPVARFLTSMSVRSARS